MKEKYYIVLEEYERRMIINSLNELRNRLIADGRYTEAVDEILIKIINAKKKQFKVICKEVICMNTDKIYAEQIANEYAPKDTSKVVALRKLDTRVKLPSVIFAYSVGIVSALIFGTGMCLVMGQIGNGTTGSIVLGIVIGVLGMIGVCINYPIYNRILENRKKKYAFEIMELAKEISCE